MAMQLVITVTDDGKVNVAGPVDNMVVAYGLLEIGRDAIREHHAAKQASAIRPATGEEIRALKVVQ